jgi:flagellar basal-body rod modification protein FlgD
MTTTSNVTSSLDNMRWQQETGVPDADDGQLDQADFFSLLTTQLANQDPTKPVENDQMIAQMTSFTMAEGINDLNSKFDNLTSAMTSNQALQASSFIGQKVLIPSEVVHVDGEGSYSGTISASSSVQNLTVTLYDKAGQIVDSVALGTHSEGAIAFEFDGKDFEGNVLPTGEYLVKASGNMGGEFQELPIATRAHVESVSISNGQILGLNLKGLGLVTLSDVYEIGES